MEFRALTTNELNQVNGGYEEIDDETRMAMLTENIISKANTAFARKFQDLDLNNEEQISYWKEKCKQYYLELSKADQALVDKYLALHPAYDWR